MPGKTPTLIPKYKKPNSQIGVAATHRPPSPTVPHPDDKQEEEDDDDDDDRGSGISGISGLSEKSSVQ